MLKGLYILGNESYDMIYGQEQRKEISNLVDIYAPQQTSESIRENLSLLNDVEVIFSGWGGPKIDQEFLDAAPNLKVVFYGAGSIKGIVSDEFWDRNILITSAYAANAVPVAEYTLSQILFCLKRGWELALTIKEKRDYYKYGFGSYVEEVSGKLPGAYKSKVGIISLGMIGSLVCELLKPFDLEVIAYDPFVSKEKAAELDVKLCSLEEIFKEADVVSLHTPWLKETEGMIIGELFKSMKKNSTFINTARGAVVNESEMIEVLKDRTDIQAVLDVTHPEPPVEGSPLYTMPNVVLTPHLAGSYHKECQRMAAYMIEELKRYLDDKPLKWQITKEKFQMLA
ncbi:phosphoglycerate dehydrogenase-like enzyme [Orenia metallireducens]|uniref:Phosphoglycerate dehydrogenase n=1 Tax=Orenia metallireducens TaxID=1413210 RepID=A0A285HWP5_9FIRM|nr:hydroxyacid dehydrogenase [Orenia metallireducens]PRX29350.1 phosphoglycerate dehydrogenase-like enzyme [Orenia metallireducens]SNY40063.1 Phosphoglycerate dehydrogenase [Orenia metallireducens]